MINKELAFKNPEELFDPAPFGFSHSVAIASPFTICYIAGQSGGAGKDHLLSTDFRIQVQVALQNLEIILTKNNMSFADVVKITLLIVDHNQQKLEIWSEEAKKAWKGAVFPTSTLIPVSLLALPNMQFEIDAVAIRKE